MAQMFLSRTGGLSTPKLGIAVILTPFLTAQNGSDAVRVFPISLRSAETGFGPSVSLAQPTIAGSSAIAAAP